MDKSVCKGKTVFIAFVLFEKYSQLNESIDRMNPTPSKFWIFRYPIKFKAYQSFAIVCHRH